MKTPPIIEPRPDSQKKPGKQERLKLIVIGALCGCLYGLVARFVFGAIDPTGTKLEVMSKAFIIGVPFAIGFISAWFSHRFPKHGPLLNAIGFGLTPILGSAAFVAVSVMIHWEGVICFVLWLPFLIPITLLGAFTGWVCLKIITTPRQKTFCFIAVAFAPFLVSPIEQMQRSAVEIRTVPTQIKIHASPETVWRQIRSVPLIQQREQSTSFSHRLGFPQPLEARLEGEGVGAVRYATFEHGVLFVETITEWQEPKKLSFAIRADTEHIPPTTFDEHVIIGGKYFDVLSGTYEIEDVGGGNVILHLSSDQRLSTRFNFYSHYWTEFLMADLQNYILQIIKKRCENAS